VKRNSRPKQQPVRASAPVLRKDRRRFLGTVGAALAAVAVSRDALATASAVVGNRLQDPACTTTTSVTQTGVLGLTGGTRTTTQALNPPSTGGGTSTYPVTVTATRGNWTGTYSYTASGTYTANGSVATVTISQPATTVTITYTKNTTTNTCQTITGTTVPTEEFCARPESVDDRFDYGDECSLS
jgi:hypothetical protein